jgi:hypothetical protein
VARVEQPFRISVIGAGQASLEECRLAEAAAWALQQARIRRRGGSAPSE